MKKFAVIVLALILALSCTSAFAATKIRVGATPAPHAEILEVAKKILAEQDSEQIVFIAKNEDGKEAVYKTGTFPDDGLRERLENANVTILQ